MNQDQVRTRLLQIENSEEYFSLIFSGKASKKVDGLYHPDKREIIIHNKNMSTDNEIIYTAIHEYAHHLQFTRSVVPVSTRVHSSSFWNLFHRLLGKAEEKGLYNNIFKTDRDFIELTAKIKKDFLAENGRMMKELGKILIEAVALCRSKNVSFEDYVDRELNLHRTAARTLIKISSLDVPPDIGYENMKTISRIKSYEERQMAEKAFLNGESPDMVRAVIGNPQENNPEPLRQLYCEKERIERTLANLKIRLSKIEQSIDKIKTH